MLPYVGFSLLQLVVHVGDLAGTFVFAEFSIAVIGMQTAVYPALRVSIVADVEFEAEPAAHRDEAVKEFVVASDPRRNDSEGGERSSEHGRLPRAALVKAAVERPEREKWNNCQRDRFGERGEAAQETEKNPVGCAFGFFETPREQKQAREFERDQTRGPRPVGTVVDAIR